MTAWSQAFLQHRDGAEPQARRSILMKSMMENEAKGFDCLACESTCCTFVANSMKVTSVELDDLVEDMIHKGRWTKDWKEKLEAQVLSDRLDGSVGDGRREFIRRTYTCPFFKVEGFGCGVARHLKPYGCLGFNPRERGLKEGGNCDLDGKAMERQRVQNAEVAEAQQKENLPLAILRRMAEDPELS